MERIKIAITGVGGGVGQSIVKSLQDTDYDLVGLDGELLGTGVYAVQTAYKIPYAKSPEFIPVLLDICKRENIKIIFPGLDAELMPLSMHRQEFEKVGTKIIVSDPNVIEISDNKLATYDKLVPFGVSIPRTFILSSNLDLIELEFPCIVKQKIGGARSKNVFIISDRADLDSFLERTNHHDDFVIQEFIDGDEYTCGTINLDGECKGVIVMRRIIRDGDTYKCFSVKNEVIEQEVRKLMRIIKPFGACNIQLRMKKNIPYVFEINARCSGTTAARTLCGFNEPKMIVDYLLKGIAPEFVIKELTILRYWKELVVENLKIDEFSRNKYLQGNETKGL